MQNSDNKITYIWDNYTFVLVTFWKKICFWSVSYFRQEKLDKVLVTQFVDYQTTSTQLMCYTLMTKNSMHYIFTKDAWFSFHS